LKRFPVSDPRTQEPDSQPVLFSALAHSPAHHYHHQRRVINHDVLATTSACRFRFRSAGLDLFLGLILVGSGLSWSGLVWAWSGTSCLSLGKLSFRAFAIIENPGPQAKGMPLMTPLNNKS